MERKYEVLVLLNPTLEQNELDVIVKDLESKMGGTIVKKEEWGKKKLAYPIQKHLEAVYILYYVETAPENIAELKQHIAIHSKEILRPLILKHEKAWPYERKTSAALRFPERKARSPYQGRPERNARPTVGVDQPEVAKKVDTAKESTPVESKVISTPKVKEDKND